MTNNNMHKLDKLLMHPDKLFMTKRKETKRPSDKLLKEFRKVFNGSLGG